MSEGQRTRAAPAPTTSQTQTQTSQSGPRNETPRVLRLRGHNETRRSVQWAEDVVDNEGLGRKSSKGKMPAFVARVVIVLTCSSLLHIPQAQGRGGVQRRVVIVRLRYRLRAREARWRQDACVWAFTSREQAEETAESECVRKGAQAEAQGWVGGKVVIFTGLRCRDFAGADFVSWRLKG
jgi:protein phosphatase 1 regulatory subunit 11